MHRMIISLSESQERKLRRVASTRRISMAATIRSAIDGLPDVVDPEREELVRRALAVVGKYRSGHSDISVNHDRYLADIYMDWDDSEDSEA